MAALSIPFRQAALHRSTPFLTFALPALASPFFLRPSYPLAATLLDWRQGIQEWLTERLLKAVPKKKVSHSRKRMRSAHKGLSLEEGLVSCPGCGKPKRPHYLCLDCYADIMLERGHKVDMDESVVLQRNGRRRMGP